eukprot:4517415-Amphidinium_carterae.1
MAHGSDWHNVQAGQRTPRDNANSGTIVYLSFHVSHKLVEDGAADYDEDVQWDRHAALGVHMLTKATDVPLFEASM